MHEVCCWLEVDAHIIVTGVPSLNAHVGDVHPFIDVWLPALFTVSCVQDVGEPMLGQISQILCGLPETRNSLYLETALHILNNTNTVMGKNLQ